jgi:hypothetical protein
VIVSVLLPTAIDLALRSNARQGYIVVHDVFALTAACR